ncbi:MAG: hypothetical protein V2J62_11065 [candidate division KSB1 bacterium]|nr:hypothetical protein [candidate division KSB1 bacterium]
MVPRFFMMLFILFFANCDIVSRANTPAALRIYSSSNMLGYLRPCG